MSFRPAVRALLVLLLAPFALVPAAPLSAQVREPEYASRRAALGRLVRDGVVVVIGAAEPQEDYLSFWQDPDLHYLTGFDEPDAALLLVTRAGQVTPTLFVQSSDPAREVWTGNRVGVAGATRLTGMPAKPIDSLGSAVTTALGSGGQLYIDTPAGLNPTSPIGIALARAKGPDPKNARLLVARLRATKSGAELDLIRRAAAITVDAQREAIRVIRPGLNEFEIQALIEYTFRRNGADRPSFATIVGSGPNSTTLHYNANNRFMAAGDLVVMDVGASYRGYAADVTRTVPVSGTFTADQRAIYDIVRAAQATAERQAKPGARANVMSDSATAVISAGLARLGLVDSPSATYDCNENGETSCPQAHLYYMHFLGHGIGLEVHDPDQYYFTGRLAPGSAFTIEPGIYVRANLLDIVPTTPRNRAMLARIAPSVRRYANIGVRIEDDYVVTDTGVEWVTRAPREAAELESLMRERSTGPAPRDSVKVNWYRATAPR